MRQRNGPHVRPGGRHTCFVVFFFSPHAGHLPVMTCPLHSMHTDKMLLPCARYGSNTLRSEPHICALRNVTNGKPFDSMFRATRALLLNILGYITILMACVFHRLTSRGLHTIYLRCLLPLGFALPVSRLISAHAVPKILVFFIHRRLIAGCETPRQGTGAFTEMLINVLCPGCINKWIRRLHNNSIFCPNDPAIN